MNLPEIVNRKPNPVPWTEGEKIPWDEPGFSRRMLREHLSQEHDAASRRFEIIDRHVEWIDRELLKGRPSNVLDLGCGPGFYCSRLARRGHACTGIDFGPASIEFALKKDREEKTGCTFIQSDVRACDFSEGRDLVMMIYGEFNTFRKADARCILTKAWNALAKGGRLLVELSSIPGLRALAASPSTWYTSTSGLFSDDPYLVMQESFWNDELQAATTRMYVVDAATGNIQQMADNHQAYGDEELTALATGCGFMKIEIHHGWPFEPQNPENDFILLVAEK